MSGSFHPINDGDWSEQAYSFGPEYIQWPSEQITWCSWFKRTLELSKKSLRYTHQAMESVEIILQSELHHPVQVPDTYTSCALNRPIVVAAVCWAWKLMVHPTINNLCYWGTSLLKVVAMRFLFGCYHIQTNETRCTSSIWLVSYILYQAEVISGCVFFSIFINENCHTLLS